MKNLTINILFLSVFTFIIPSTAFAVYGIPDQKPAATLIVPLMEKGISSAHNTNTVVHNTCGYPITLHWEIWDVYGVTANIYGNIVISGNDWISDFGTILASATPAKLAQLTDGTFYRGFMTIDIVTGSTELRPTNPGYPFSGLNCLTGFIYYVRLLEGAANGIPMIHIEGGLSSALHENTRGFYQLNDDREEIDNHARYYAARTTAGLSIINDPDYKTDFVINRVFLSGNGESRIVLWAWAPAGWGADTSSAEAGGASGYIHYSESGSAVVSTSISLSRIVNIITPSNDVNGTVWISNVADDFNIFAFTFNAANYTLNPALTWEAMLESTIIVE